MFTHPLDSQYLIIIALLSNIYKSFLLKSEAGLNGVPVSREDRTKQLGLAERHLQMFREGWGGGGGGASRLDVWEYLSTILDSVVTYI